MEISSSLLPTRSSRPSRRPSRLRLGSLLALSVASLLPTPAWAACPTGYNINGCNSMCTQASSYSVSCDLGASAGSGNVDAWAVSPTGTTLRAWGTDESAAPWCCEFTVVGCQATFTITGTPQIDTVDLNYGGLHSTVGTWVYGGAGNDILLASNDASCTSHLYGDAGDDQLTGFAGNDELYGGDDDDTINAGDGDDNIYGEDGTDHVNGQGGIDYIEMGTGGADLAKGGDGPDLIIGGTGNSFLCGGDGDDEIRSIAVSPHFSYLYGMVGSDDLYQDGTGGVTCEVVGDGGYRDPSCSNVLTGCFW